MFEFVGLVHVSRAPGQSTPVTVRLLVGTVLTAKGLDEQYAASMLSKVVVRATLTRLALAEYVYISLPATVCLSGISMRE